MERRDILGAISGSILASSISGSAHGWSDPPRLVKSGSGVSNEDVAVSGGGDRPVGARFASRSPAFGANGAAASAHPMATLAAVEILKRGGSAADAAIALNACLGVVEPCSCGIGGDVYALVWDPKAARVRGLASSGRSPMGLSLETARSRTVGSTLPTFGAVTTSVPGAVAGWWTLHQRYGKLAWAELFAAAIGMAEQGTIIPPVVAFWMKQGMAALRNAKVEELDNAVRIWTRGGEPYATGDLFRNPDLGRTYRMIAEGGADAFYKGEVAAVSERYFKRIGGWLSRADFAAHRADWVEPLTTSYRGVDVHAIGENTQGLATLQMLNILETFDMKTAGFQSARSIHLQAEAKRLAFEDRARYYGDPAFAGTPAEALISKEYAARRAGLIHPDRMMDQVAHGNVPSKGDTTYFTVADGDGLVISMIQSNYMLFGSGMVPDGLGFMFQNRGQLFSFQDGHPNRYAPGKRPFQTIIPGFATKAGAPWMSFGVMGGDMQPQGQVQTLLNRIDYGLNVQEAGDAPRWHHAGSSESMGEDFGAKSPKGMLDLERNVPEVTKRQLAALGWPVREAFPNFGRYYAIEVNRTSNPYYAAAADMRADGAALAF